MTDIEYIRAFKANNQRAITSFFSSEEKQFKRFIASKYATCNDELLSEVYVSSVLRLWENVQRDKLSETSLSASLSTYLCSIGINVMRETKRKYKEIVPEQDDEWEMVQNIASVMDAWDSVVDEAEKERQEAIGEAVNQMGEPCAPLLISFYWDELSMEEITQKLGYKDDKSAKTQKYKCMQKLKTKLKRML